MRASEVALTPHEYCEGSLLSNTTAILRLDGRLTRTHTCDRRVADVRIVVSVFLAKISRSFAAFYAVHFEVAQ